MLLATGEPPGNIDSNAVAAVPIDAYAGLVELFVYQRGFSRAIGIGKCVDSKVQAEKIFEKYIVQL